MYITNMLYPEKVLDPYEEDFDEHPEHTILGERLRKTLYYGRTPGTERPSMPLTELAVEYFRDAAPKELGRVDMYFASNVGRKAYASPTSVMASMLYVRRLRTRNPEYLQQITSSDLFLISMLVASKYMYDEGTDEEVYNDEWADAADMETKDINDLEREFLAAVDWNLFTCEEEFNNVLLNIEAAIAWKEGGRRGHFTYTDLLALSNKLLPSEAVAELVADMAKVMAVCSMAYFAGCMTLAASPAALKMVQSALIVAPSVLPGLLTSDTTTNRNEISNTSFNPLKNDGDTDAEHKSDSIVVSSEVLVDENHDSHHESALLQARFVAMALIQETVAHFLNAFAKVGNVKSDDNLGINHGQDLLAAGETEWKCQCGGCPWKMLDRCHNVTVWDAENDYGSELGQSVWLHACKCSHKGTKSDSSRSCQLGHVCCCCPYGSTPPIGRPFPDVIHGFQTQPIAVG